MTLVLLVSESGLVVLEGFVDGTLCHGLLWSLPPVSLVTLERKTSKLSLLRLPEQNNGTPLALGEYVKF